MINELAKQIHQNAIDKGFFEKEKNIGEMLMLIVTERYKKGVRGDKLFYKGNMRSFEKTYTSH